MSWISRLLRRKTPAPHAPVLSGRRDVDARPHMDFAEFTPELGQFLGQAAYVQIVIFEGIARAVLAAASVADKEALVKASAAAVRKQRKLVKLIRSTGLEPAEVMSPFAPAIDAFNDSTVGHDWWELLVSSYVTAGMLDEFFVGLAVGLPKPYSSQVSAILEVPGATEVLAGLLHSGIEQDPVLADRLALWARRLVGDTLLVARSALEGASTIDEVEPVFTELIAGHSRRMDALGLTA